MEKEKKSNPAREKESQSKSEKESKFEYSYLNKSISERLQIQMAEHNQLSEGPKSQEEDSKKEDEGNRRENLSFPPIGKSNYINILIFIIENTYEELKKMITKQDLRNEAIEKEIKNMHNEMKTDMKAMNSEMKAMNSEMKAMNSEMKAMNSEMKKMNENFKSLNNKFDSLNDNLTDNFKILTSTNENMAKNFEMLATTILKFMSPKSTDEKKGKIDEVKFEDEGKKKRRRCKRKRQ